MVLLELLLWLIGQLFVVWLAAMAVIGLLMLFGGVLAAVGALFTSIIELPVVVKIYRVGSCPVSLLWGYCVTGTVVYSEEDTPESSGTLLKELES